MFIGSQESDKQSVCSKKCRHTIYCGMREAPYLVLKMLSKRATKVVSRPGTSALVCKALKARKTNQFRKSLKKKIEI